VGRKARQYTQKRRNGDSVKRRPEDEASLFRDLMRDVKRLPGQARLPERRKPPPRARFSAPRLREDRKPALERGDSLHYADGGTRRAALRELRRGRVRPEAELDLHGLTVARAERALRDFLGEAFVRGFRCVRIVHGKGLHSGPAGPTLKNLVDSVLRGTRGVQAFTSARPADGGAGAVNVLLER
jgi:DNA-nicking Smr family endonuclease